MSTEQTKQIISGYFDAMNRRDEAALLDMTTDDFQFQMMARSPAWLATKLDRTMFAKTPAMLSQLMHEPIRLDIVQIVVEGDNAAVEAVTDCKMLNGTRYNNAYHFAFRLSGGKLAEIREYGCSHLAVTCFPELAPTS